MTLWWVWMEILGRHWVCLIKLQSIVVCCCLQHHPKTFHILQDRVKKGIIGKALNKDPPAQDLFREEVNSLLTALIVQIETKLGT